MKKFTPWLVGALVIGGLGFWLYKTVTKPLPGEAVTEVGGAELSREHTTDIADVVYSTNPPAGGKHFPIWAKPGVYNRFISDGYFLHSLEHGYIVISYDCSKLSTSSRFVSTALAHEDEPVEGVADSGKPLMHMTTKVAAGTSWITPENQPEVEIELPESFKTESCQSLVSELAEFTKVAQRVILAPRQGMETTVALTAWGRILKLQNVDSEAIKAFINTFHNRGPEATME